MPHEPQNPNPDQKSECRSRFHSAITVATILLVVRLLLLSLSGGLGDTVKITLAGLGDAAATLLLVDLDDTDLLKSLEDLAVDATGGIDVLGGADTSVLGGTVDLSETADTDGLAHVDVAGDGGGAHVEPVNVLCRESGLAINATPAAIESGGK